MVQVTGEAAIEQGSFVELRGRPWLVEEVRGEASDLQTLNLSCISDDAQGERLEIIWDAEIGAGSGLPTNGQEGNGRGAGPPADSAILCREREIVRTVVREKLSKRPT
jgi:hypothetical protein